MKKLVLQFFLLIVATMLQHTLVANVTIVNSSSNSLQISTTSSDDNKAYYLDIYVKGIDASKVMIKHKSQTLFMTARRGTGFAQSSISSGQLINYSYSFPNDADMKNFSRLNTKHKIRISIPRN